MRRKSSQSSNTNPNSDSRRKGLTKDSLIRMSIKKRIKDQKLKVSPEYVDEMPMMSLMNFPEATVVTIVEVYSGLRQKGGSEKKSIKQIETIRSSAGQGKFNSKFSLSDFVQYRLQIEHPNDDLTEEHIGDLMRESFTLFWNQNTNGSVSENRIVALSFGLTIITIGLVVGLYFGGWTWILTAISILLALPPLRIGLKANEDELAMLTGDLPEMSVNELNEFYKKIHR